MDLAELAHTIWTWVGLVAAPIAGLVAASPRASRLVSALSPMLAGVLIAALYYRYFWHRGRKPLRIKRVLRLIFARRFIAHRSHRLDVMLMVGNMFVFSMMFSWAVLSYMTVKVATTAVWVAAFGAGPIVTVPVSAAIAIATVMLFLAYEFAYWLDHYLSHRIPILWEFHKVHHSAEALSPLTNYRVHPVDSLLFYNISALVIGLTGGTLGYVFGESLRPMTLLGMNAIMCVFVYLVVQLQHSQVWIPFTGLLGRILASPAHHQIHHSTDPLHFNKNLGSCLVLFDWVFGTLHVPKRQRERLTFGVDAGVAESHSLSDALITPFARAARHVAGALQPIRAMAVRIMAVRLMVPAMLRAKPAK